MFASFLIRGADAGEAEVRRFEKEYPSAARRLIATYDPVRGTYHFAGREASLSITAAVDEGRRLEVAHISAEGVKAEAVTCVAGERTFQVTKGPGESDYQLASLDSADPEVNPFASELDPVLSAPYAIGRFPFIDIVEAPIFHLLGAEAVRDRERDCIEVEFEMVNTSGVPPMKGVVLLDPGLGWAIRHAEFGGGPQPGSTQSQEVRYGETQNGVPIPSEVEEVGLDGGVARYTLKEFVFESTPDEQFTLEYYGIPDPDAGEEAPAIERRGTNWLVWIIGTGVVGLILAAVLRRLGRR